MTMKDILFALCSEAGISGNEVSASEKASDIISQYARVSRDASGNTYATMGKDGQKNILIDAHIDQIGFVVTKIDDNGFIKLSPCGGADMRVLNDTLLTVMGKKRISAVVCCLPPHLSDGNEDKAVSKQKIWADTGLSGEQAKKLISIGDKVVFAQKPSVLLGTRISAPSLDDRAGIAVLIQCAEMLSKVNLNCKVTFLFSSKEEVGGMGARVASYATAPDEAIALDVSFASQQGVPADSCGKLSEGAMIGMAPVLNKKMTKELMSLAKKYKIPHQLEVMGGTTGTNADDICIARSGVPTALISIPQRNMHTPAEIIDIKDIEACSRLIFKYITEVFDKEV